MCRSDCKKKKKKWGRGGGKRKIEITEDLFVC